MRGAIAVFRHHPVSHLCALCVLCGEKLLVLGKFGVTPPQSVTSCEITHENRLGVRPGTGLVTALSAKSAKSAVKFVFLTADDAD